ncbi:MAG: hypothetical protein HQL83_14455, partial [Magnetococcales bacterium]|nr:hypothetical protein [Magnetococcales bacterium]
DHFPDSPIPIQLWAFNLSQLNPWQWLSLFSALATLFIYVQSDEAMLRWKRIMELYGKQADPSPTDLKWLWRITRLRNISSFFWILLSVGYVLLIWGTIPPETLHGGWMGFLGWIYDNDLPPMP